MQPVMEVLPSLPLVYVTSQVSQATAYPEESQVPEAHLRRWGLVARIDLEKGPGRIFRTSNRCYPFVPVVVALIQNFRWKMSSLIFS